MNDGGDDFGDFPPNLIPKLVQEKFPIQWQSDFSRQSLPDKKLKRTYSKLKLNFKSEKYLYY